MTDPNVGMSIRQYAAYRKEQGLPGGSPWSVKKALRDRRISRNRHGKIDPEVADREWALNTDPAQQRDTEQAQEAPQGRQVGPRERDASAVGVPSYSQSRAIKEAYQARISKLQFEEMTGKLVSSDAVKVEAFRRARMTRDQILSVPDRVAPVIAAESDERKVREILDTELRNALEVLADG
jgi:hypothetical protein